MRLRPRLPYIYRDIAFYPNVCKLCDLQYRIEVIQCLSCKEPLSKLGQLELNWEGADYPAKEIVDPGASQGPSRGIVE